MRFRSPGANFRSSTCAVGNITVVDKLVAVEPRPLEEGAVDVRQLIEVLFRRRWYFVTAMIVCLAAGVLVSMRATRIYRATTTIMIERETPKVLGEVREVYDLGTGGYWNSQEYYKTQYEVIRSRPVAEKAAASLGIRSPILAEALRALGPESTEARAAGTPLADIPEDVRRRLELIGMARYKSRDEMLAALEGFDAAGYIAGRLSVEAVKDSRLVHISVDHPSPKYAALVADAVAQAYVEANLDQKVDFTRSAIDWLADQMHELKAKLEASELALYEFKKANNIISVSIEDRQNIISQTLGQLNESLSQMRAESMAMESRRSRIRRAQAAGADATVDAVINNELVQQLKMARSVVKQEESELASRYTPDHPKLAAARTKLELVSSDLESEVERILAALDAQYQEALETENRLRAAIEKEKREALEVNKKEIEYSRLTRERDNNRDLYDLVLKRQKEADLTEMLKVNNVRIHEPARTPRSPIRPRTAVNMLAALVLGLVLGIGLALVVDFLDNTIKSQEQVERLLGLPFLGILPVIKGDSRSGPPVRDHYIVANPRSSVAECCRTIRTNLLFMSPETPARQILITSSGPREGKSTATVNLAVTMAQSGVRTVLVDSDMRRPRLHRSFDLESDIGVSNVILGDANVADVLQPTDVDGLSVVPCGPIPPNPAELLHTERFRTFVAELSQRFDRVLFDSPPVGAVTDPLVLASMVDGVVFVVQASKTPWPDAKQAIRRIKDVGGKVFGVVLNSVDLEDRQYGAYYQYYYYRSGYGDEPKKKAAG